MDNAVARAVRAVGGPTQAQFICRVSAAAIYKWRKLGFVYDSRAAVRLSEATQATDTPVSVTELAGLQVVNGGGDDDEPRKKGGRVLSPTYQGSSPALTVPGRHGEKVYIDQPPDTAARAA